MEHRIELRNGAVLVGDISPKPGKWAHVFTILVPESQRRQGHGTRMLQQFESAAAEAQASRIDMLVSSILTKREERSGIIAWLEQNGYQKEGIDIGFGPMYVKRLTKLRHRRGRRTTG